ncbi:hypothetical protein H0H81_012534 [Sphagnurus paluster]|uniref:Phospholipid/glycerol acyltransferase domain-containing protein n=1 Tax=Sphagnurus paluster TaxID=117069 RepID=A0A9P7FUA1_9AGAR|nr:hypothetical protein H0H81_012534 [Sphagnurus paluster]
MLRLTAKATQFGHRTFTSWLIESAGTVPIKRRKDSPDGTADNTDAMLKLVEALETGDAVCLFPEGMSRYHPTIAPLKTGVARLVSDVLTRNHDDPNFEISVLTCSVTYMYSSHASFDFYPDPYTHRHRQHFRSDVLVTFHEPMVFRVKDHPELIAPVEYDHIRQLTARMHHVISSGTIDSPTWDLIRTAKLAARIYAPLGTRMSLGDYVRSIRSFIDAFKDIEQDSEDNEEKDDAAELRLLRDDLKAYQDQLVHWGIKDDRIRRPLSRRTILYRMFMRLVWSTTLFTISLPGLLLWLPIFGTTFYAAHNYKKTGPIFDTWDEIAQYKLIYGLFSGLLVCFTTVLLTWSTTPWSTVVVPAFMWMTLRWFEDAVSSFRAFTALYRLLRVGKPTLKNMHTKREDLHSRVMNLAHAIGLPEDPESHFMETGGLSGKGRVKDSWDSTRRYFSIRRRRKRDWNETLRLYDKVDYPEEDI